jgi:hypothetical protein
MFRVIEDNDEFVLEFEDGQPPETFKTKRSLVAGIRHYLGMPHQGRPWGAKNKVKEGVDKTPE